MNICLISRELYPFQKAGIGVYTYYLALALLKAGNNVYIITEKENAEADSPLKENGALVIPVDSSIHSNFFSNFNLLYSYKVFETLKELTSTTKIDVVESADYFGELFFILLYKDVKNLFGSIPVVLKIHTPSFECIQFNNSTNSTDSLKPSDFDVFSQEDYCIKNADFVYSISHALKQLIEKRLKTIRPIEVQYNILGLPEYDHDNLDSTNVANNNKKTILVVGRLDYIKGTDLFIKASLRLLDQFDDVEFLIVGKDTIDSATGKSFKAVLLDLIPPEKRNFFDFSDTVPREQLNLLYRSAYIAVFPSRWEGFGNVCIEAMANGCPVLVSNVGGMIEIIDHGKAGLFFESENVKDLIRKLEDIISNPLERNEWKEKAVKRSKLFLDKALIENQMSFYKRVIKDYQFKQDHNIYPDKRQFFVKQWLHYIENAINIQTLNNELIVEVTRVTKEWEIVANQNRSLQDEVNRVTNKWEIVAKSNQSLRKELSHVMGELNLEKIVIQQERDKIDDLKNEKEQLLAEISELKKNMQSRKWLAKKLLLNKGDE